MRGDIDKQTASEADASSAAVPMYTKAIAEFESLEQPSNAAIKDACDMYMYMGNYYIKGGDNANAKAMFNKYLELRPNDEAVRNYVNTL